MTASARKPISDLPKVVEITEITDAGEFGGASCPHCGADGRYITWFLTEDGQRRGAMRGCFALFPKSRYADRVERILQKERESAKTGRNLASWDREVLEAIRAFTRAEQTAEQTDAVIRSADNAKRLWIGKRYGGRR
jgi:hypothetical protein